MTLVPGPVPDFLRGGGAMGATIRAHDWAASPMGPPAGWPQPLRVALSICLSSTIPTAVYWGPELRLLYNDAWMPIPAERHPWALGRPAAEVWSDIWEVIAPQLAGVLASGQGVSSLDQMLPMERGGIAHETYWTYSFAPIRDEAGQVVGVFNQGHETTNRVLGERRQAFHLALADRLRDLADPVEIVGAVCEALARHLGAAQVVYAAVNATEGSAHVESVWANGALPALGQTHRIADYGAPLAAELWDGRTTAIADVREDERTNAPGALTALARLGIGSLLNVPLVKEGQLVAVLSVHDAKPRRWRPDEVSLAEGMAERAWAAAARARAEQALRDSEEHYRFAVELNPQVAWTATPDGQLDRVSERWRDWTGTSGLGASWGEGLHPDDLARTVEAWTRSVTTGVPYDIEHRVRHLSGEYRWAHSRAWPRRDAGGSILRWYGSTENIHGRKLAEAGLRELNEALERRVAEALAQRKLLAEVVDGADVIWQVVDSDFRFLALNKAAVREFHRVFGVVPEAGDSLLDLLAPWPEQHAAAHGFWARTLAGEAFTATAEFGDPGRDRRFYEMRFSPLRDAGGEVTGGYQLVHDVTDRLRGQAELEAAQEALLQSQKMEAMGQLTGGVAHDFNNLLTPIVGSLDLLQRKGLGNERERRLIEGAAQAAERAKTLVQRLLAFARRQPLQTRAVDVAALVEGMAGLLSSTLGPRIRLELELEPGLPAARADAHQLEMALLNLAVNARDAMPEGGRLGVAARLGEAGPGAPRRLHPGRYLRLLVTDSGAGMDAETARRAVEPFFSTKGIGKGTGLGLSMVHGLAAQLGGALAIRSALGAGTEVELWLPEGGEEAAPPGPDGAVLHAEGRAGTALLVDDEALVRASTADMLAEIGFRVVEAASAEEALRLLDEGLAPDLLATDHLMPGMTGTELAHEMRRRRPGLQVLIVSGYAEADGLPADLPRLTKPFRQSDLAAAVAELGRG